MLPNQQQTFATPQAPLAAGSGGGYQHSNPGSQPPTNLASVPSPYAASPQSSAYASQSNYAAQSGAAPASAGGYAASPGLPGGATQYASHARLQRFPVPAPPQFGASPGTAAAGGTFRRSATGVLLPTQINPSALGGVNRGQFIAPPQPGAEHIGSAAMANRLPFSPLNAQGQPINPNMPIGESTDALDGFEEKLESLLECFRRVGLLASDFRTESQEEVGRRMREMISLMQQLEKYRPALADKFVPVEVLRTVEEARNPQMFTKACLEKVVQKNEELKGRVHAFTKLRTQLMGDLAKVFPDEMVAYRNLRAEHYKNDYGVLM